jgi:peptidoglycan/LPS O-acetylase OafA/YrhL
MKPTEAASRSGDSTSPPVPSPPARFYLPELDSLRFFAFFAVFVWHIRPLPDWVLAAPQKNVVETLAVAIWQASEFGVDLFFTLSAYLITELLVREKIEFGRIDIRAFYVRRILRIWPLYYGFLGAYFAGLWGLSRALVPWRALPWFAVFAGNFAMYRGAFVTLQLGILWSVSLEEQFYLVWPWVVSRLSRRRLVVVAILVWTFSILYRWWLVAEGAEPAKIWWNSFARLDPLACGVLLSALLGGSTRNRFENSRRIVAVAGVSLILAAGYCSPREVNGGAVWMTLAYPLAALGCAAIVLAALGLGTGPDSWLCNPLLKYLGRISYGLYVFHATVILVTVELLRGLESEPVVFWTVFPPLALALTIGIAAASYEWFEKPFLKLKSRFQYVRSMPV